MTLEDYYFLIPFATSFVILPLAAWIWRMQGRVQKMETKQEYLERDLERMSKNDDHIIAKLTSIAEDLAAVKARLNHK